jgi:hypothetical protein
MQATSFDSRAAIERLRENPDLCDLLRNRVQSWENGVQIAHRLANDWITDSFAGSPMGARGITAALMHARESMVAAVFTVAR